MAVWQSGRAGQRLFPQEDWARARRKICTHSRIEMLGTARHVRDFRSFGPCAGRCPVGFGFPDMLWGRIGVSYTTTTMPANRVPPPKTTVGVVEVARALNGLALRNSSFFPFSFHRWLAADGG